MTYFLKSGNNFRVATKEALDLHELLPPGNYTVQQNQMTNEYFLTAIGNFTIPNKVYGDCTRHTRRIIDTFTDRSVTTGVMLTGEKGSGKTLLSKNVCVELAKQGIPTIVINAPHCGDNFNAFLQSIEQSCVVLFDEFEKVYNRESQEAILTLLDGVFPTKKLFILTCNDKYRIDSHMRNRPGRIYYMLDFNGLDSDFITEYCQENLKEVRHTSDIVSIAGIFNQFNFDMLKSLVEEINRYGDSPQEALELLNVKPEFDYGVQFDMSIVHNGKAIEDYTNEFEGNPIINKVPVAFYSAPDNQNDDDDERYIHKVFDTTSLVKLDATKGMFVFQDKDTQVTLTRKEVKRFTYKDLI